MEDFRDFKKELRKTYNNETIKEFVFFNQKLIDFVHKEPRHINRKDIEYYLLHLVEFYGAKSDTVNIALFALISYYRDFIVKHSTLKQIYPVLTTKDIAEIIDKAGAQTQGKVNMLNTITSL